MNKHNISNGKVKRLTPKLKNKAKYVFYYQNLQLNLQSGIKLSKIQSE